MTKSVKLYVLDLSPLEDGGTFGAYYAQQPVWRKDNVDLFRRRADKIRSLGAGVLLQKALPGADLETVSFGENGKPFLPDAGVEFNLSHAGGFAVCAVGPSAVGCDIERMQKYDLSVARRFFCAEETRLLEAAPSPEAQADLFFRLWTLKESYLKAVGKGLCQPLNSFCVSFASGAPVLSGYERLWQFREFGIAEGYRCAVCAAAGTPIDETPRRIEL